MSTARSNLVEVNMGALASNSKRPKIDYLAPAAASNSYIGAKFLLECGESLNAKRTIECVLFDLTSSLLSGIQCVF